MAIKRVGETRRNNLSFQQAVQNMDQHSDLEITQEIENREPSRLADHSKNQI
jgi:hypothetical protein